MKRPLHWLTLTGFSIVCLLGTLIVQAVPLIELNSTALNATDYSDSGLNLGNSGFWFANFAASTPVMDAPVD